MVLLSVRIDSVHACMVRRGTGPPCRSEMARREHSTARQLRVTPNSLAICSRLLPSASSVGMLAYISFVMRGFVICLLVLGPWPLGAWSWLLGPWPSPWSRGPIMPAPVAFRLPSTVADDAQVQPFHSFPPS